MKTQNTQKNASLNDALEAGKLDQLNTKKPVPGTNDRYAIKLKDLKGNEVVIKYY